ncbi:hypothetical protein BS78_02G071800 [Paspalum vaginatum]|nr:hypothetical protein BS78_02G071800 [Paspalum vaginatum]
MARLTQVQGDLNRIIVKVWGAKPEKIQNVFHIDLGKANVDSHKHTKNPDGSFTVEAFVRVDVGRIYPYLEKIASGVKIESFVQLEDVKVETTREEQYKDELESELEEAGENYYGRHLEMKLIASVEEEEHKLLDRITGQLLEMKTTRRRTTRISMDEVVEERRLIKISKDGGRRMIHQ